MVDYRMYELQISYLTKRLAEMPHGSFGMSRGEKVVYVTYDPCNNNVDKHHKMVFRVDSKSGRFWSPLIAEYIKVSKQLQELINIWNSIFRCDPRKLTYPLEKSKATIMTDEFFYSAREYCNPTVAEHPVDYNGRALRSKNEHMGCQIMDKLGLEYKIEIAVGSDPFNLMYPDITFVVPSQQRCIGIEINGALDKPKYVDRTVNKHKTYLDYGLRMSKDIIFVDIADGSQFYADVFETQVKTAILAGLDDIVFPYGVEEIYRDSGNGELWI